MFSKKNHDIFVDLNLILRVHMYIVYIIFSYNDAFNHGYDCDLACALEHF